MLMVLGYTAVAIITTKYLVRSEPTGKMPRHKLNVD